MTQIFISYSSRDRAMIDVLADELDALGYTVWFDRELNRLGGHQWWAEIMEALRQSDVFLYAVSPNLIKSEPCRREYNYAVTLGKPIFPAKIVDVNYRDLPLEIQDLQIFDARDLRPVAQRRAIRESINSLPPKPPLPANARDLEQEIPRDPVAVLFDRINELTSDVEQQRSVIMAIEDLHADGHPHEDTIALLQRLIGRDDVLVFRNVKRAEDLLAKAKAAHGGESSVLVIPPSLPPIAVAEPKLGDPRYVLSVSMPYVPPMPQSLFDADKSALGKEAKFDQTIIDSSLRRLSMSAEEYAERAYKYFNVDMYEEAFTDFEQAILLEPTNPDLFMGRGLCLYAVDDYISAIHDINRAIRLDSKNGDYYFVRASIHQALRFPFDAQRDLEMAATLGNEQAKQEISSYRKG